MHHGLPDGMEKVQFTWLVTHTKNSSGDGAHKAKPDHKLVAHYRWFAKVMGPPPPLAEKKLPFWGEI